MDTCPTCGTVDFINQDGHYYCYECGTQSQERRDEIVDDDEMTKNDFSNFQQIAGKRGVKRNIDQLLTDSKNDDDDVIYHQCWQRIFQSLLKELTKLGYGMSIEHSGKLFWFLYLRNIFKKQFDTFGIVDGFDKQVTKRQQQLVNKKKCIPSFTRRRALSKRIMVTLLFFTSIFADQFIPLHELLSLVQSGRLSLPHDITQTKSKRMLQILHTYYNEMTVLYSLSYYTQIDAFKEVIKIPQNKFPINLVEIGNNLLEKMLLPSSLRPLLQRLLRLYHDTNMSLHYYNNIFYGTVSVKIMSVIIVLLKLVYRLDDKYEYVQADLADLCNQSQIDMNNAVYCWQDWVTMATIHHYNTVQTTFQPTYQDMFLIDNSPACYLNHCINVSFKHYTVPVKSKSLVQLEDKLNSSYSLYLTNKRARRKRQTSTIGSCNITGTSPSFRTRWLYQTLQDKVIAIDSSNKAPKPLSWFPLTLSIPHLGGRGCEHYQPLPLSLNNENAEGVLTDVGVSSSQLFLLKFAANVLRVPIRVLLMRVIHVEQTLRPQSFLSSMTFNIFNKASQMDTRIQYED